MIEYFLVICMFVPVEIDGVAKAFESTGSPRVECAKPLERRGPHSDEQACIKANQTLGLELGLDKRGKDYMAMCHGEYREVPYAPETRQQQRDSEQQHQRTRPLRQAPGPGSRDSYVAGRHQEETA